MVSTIFTLFTIQKEKEAEIISYTKKFIWKMIKETFSFFIIHTVFPCLSLSISNADIIQNNGELSIVNKQKETIAKPWLGVETRIHRRNQCEECEKEDDMMLPIIQFRDDIPVIMHVCHHCVHRIHVSV